MTMHRFALIILIGLFSGPNAALAADDSQVADASGAKVIADVSVGAGDLSKSVEVDGQSWRIRHAQNPTGSMVLIRNETLVSLLVSFVGEAGRESERVLAGGAIVQRCEAGSARPWAVSRERGERVLNAQLTCGDSVVVQSAGRTSTRLEPINEAWALPPGESVAEPRMAEGH